VAARTQPCKKASPDFEVYVAERAPTDDGHLIHFSRQATTRTVPKAAVHVPQGRGSNTASTGRYALRTQPRHRFYWCTGDPGWVCYRRLFLWTFIATVSLCIRATAESWHEAELTRPLVSDLEREKKSRSWLPHAPNRHPHFDDAGSGKSWPPAGWISRL